MRCVSVLSTAQDPDEALKEVVALARTRLGTGTADLALIFATAHHAEAMGRIAAEVRSQGLSRHVLGCTGESVVGDHFEIEGKPGLALWAIGLPGCEIRPRRITHEADGFPGWSDSLPDPRNPPALIALGDPFTFPADKFLKAVNEGAPGVRVVGGMASASQDRGGNRLILDGEVFDDGAVAVEILGPVTLRTVVSQGCRPVGQSFIVTKADRNIIRELGRRPALEVLREVFSQLDPDDQERVQQGLHIGRAISEYQESFGRGDFLVRNVIGADDEGGIAITDLIRVGQTVQFHVRDADSADEDLRSLLENERLARPRSKILGSLLFTCNGRGTRLFRAPNHDVDALHHYLGNVPVAGFFAMGELGPVGGENFIHGFTASIVVFEMQEVGDFGQEGPLAPDADRGEMLA